MLPSVIQLQKQQLMMNKVWITLEVEWWNNKPLSEYGVECRIEETSVS